MRLEGNCRPCCTERLFHWYVPGMYYHLSHRTNLHTISRRLHVASTYTLLPTNMQGTSKQRKPICRKLKDVFNNFKASFSRTPGPLAQGESSQTGDEADVCKRLCLDCQQGLMSETNTQLDRGPTQRL